MSDEVLIDMSRQLGELNGKLDAHLKNQDRINTALFELVDKQDKRIRGTEATSNKAVGVAGVASLCMTGVIEFFSRMVHHGGGS